jgi:hypothetical protein
MCSVEQRESAVECKMNATSKRLSQMKGGEEEESRDLQIALS